MNDVNRAIIRRLRADLRKLGCNPAALEVEALACESLHTLITLIEAMDTRIEDIATAVNARRPVRS